MSNGYQLAEKPLRERTGDISFFELSGSRALVRPKGWRRWETDMLYSILCYNSEAESAAWTQEEDDALMAKNAVVEKGLAAQGKLGPVARLMPTTTATTLRSGREPLVIDGPFAETKEQLLGFYVLDCATLEEAIETARAFLGEAGALEIRPIAAFDPGVGVT